MRSGVAAFLQGLLERRKAGQFLWHAESPQGRTDMGRAEHETPVLSGVLSRQRMDDPATARQEG
jgi:hypothetical protein